MLPEVSMASNTVEPSVTDASCYLYSYGTDHQVLLAACQYETPDARATDVAAAVFEHCRPEHTVVLATASTSSSALRGAPPPPGGAFAVSTDAAVSAVAAAAAPTLPPGCVMDGLPAALLSHVRNDLPPPYIVVSSPGDTEPRRFGSSWAFSHFPRLPRRSERCSDGVEDQGAEEAFVGYTPRDRIVSSVLEAVSRASGFSFQRAKHFSVAPELIPTQDLAHDFLRAAHCTRSLCTVAPCPHRRYVPGSPNCASHRTYPG